MERKEVFQQLFAGKESHYRTAVHLQQEYARLKNVFEQFAKHLEECGGDPQFFHEIAKVDATALNQQLVTLAVFGGNELRLCFDVIRQETEVSGQITCYFVRAHQRAQRDLQVRPEEIGRWTFRGNGDTNINPGGSGDVLDMREPKHAVAIAVVLIIAAYSAPPAPSLTKGGKGEGLAR